MRQHSQRGAVLVIVLMVLIGLLGLGVTALWLTSGNLQVASNQSQRTQALYVAEAGVAHARQVIVATFTPPGPGAPGINALLAGTGNANDDVPTAVRPQGIGAIMVDTVTTTQPPGGFMVDVPYPPAGFGRGTGTIDNPQAQFMGRYTVWVRNDMNEIRLAQAGVAGNSYLADGNGAVVVRVRGVATDGLTNVILEVPLASTGGGAGDGGLLNLGSSNPGYYGKNSTSENNGVNALFVAN